MEIKIFIPGEPQAKERPRTYIRNVRGITKSHTYTPSKTLDYEAMIALSYAQTISHYWEKSPLKIDIIAYFLIPKSFNKNKIKLVEQGKVVPTKKDWDNVGKIITDSLNKCAYDDDRYIIEARVIKVYTFDNPGVLITIKDAKNLYKIYNKGGIQYDLYKMPTNGIKKF